MKNYKTKTSFVSLEWPDARANKIGFNPSDINQFRSHTGKRILQNKIF